MTLVDKRLLDEMAAGRRRAAEGNAREADRLLASGDGAAACSLYALNVGLYRSIGDSAAAVDALQKAKGALDAELARAAGKEVSRG